MQFHREYRRFLPHFQNAGQYYHVTISTCGGLKLTLEQRKIVFDACQFYDGTLWDLAADAILDDHGHILAAPRPLPDNPGEYYKLETILQRLKGYTGKRINELNGTHGPVWNRESFDREIRNARDFWKVANYIYYNPREAGFGDDYPFVYLNGQMLLELDFNGIRL